MPFTESFQHKFNVGDLVSLKSNGYKAYVILSFGALFGSLPTTYGYSNLSGVLYSIRTGNMNVVEVLEHELELFQATKEEPKNELEQIMKEKDSANPL